MKRWGDQGVVQALPLTTRCCTETTCTHAHKYMPIPRTRPANHVHVHVRIPTHNPLPATQTHILFFCYRTCLHVLAQ